MINVAGIIPEYFDIFGLRFYLYGLVIGLCILLLYALVRGRLEEKKFTEKELDTLLISSTIAGLIGGRVFYVLLNWQLYAVYEDPLTEAFKIWNGGIQLFGVFLGVILALLVFSKSMKRAFFEVADDIVIYLPIAQALGRLANLINFELFGPPTNLPWAFFVPKAKRVAEYANYDSFHPLFLYEALLSLVNYFVLRFFAKRNFGPGLLTAIYFLNYSVIRFFLEFLRLDRVEFAAGTSIVQIICLGLIILCGGFLIRYYLKSNERRAKEF